MTCRGALLAGLMLAGLAAAEPVALTVAGDRVTVRATDVAAGDVLTALADASGATVMGAVVEAHRVTLDVADEPVERLLRRVLGDQNFAVRYRRDGVPAAITLYGTAGSAPLPTTSPAPETPPTTTAPTRLGLPRRFGGRRSLALPEPLGERFGDTTASVDELVDVMLEWEDGSTRLLAAQVVLSELERNRQLRRKLIDALRDVRGVAAAGGLGGAKGGRLLEMLEYFAAHSREPSLQHKTQVVLDDLGARPR